MVSSVSSSADLEAIYSLFNAFKTEKTEEFNLENNEALSGVSTLNNENLVQNQMGGYSSCADLINANRNFTPLRIEIKNNEELEDLKRDLSDFIKKLDEKLKTALDKVDSTQEFNEETGMEKKNKNFLDGIILKLCEKFRQMMLEKKNPENIEAVDKTESEKNGLTQEEVKNIFNQSKMLPDDTEINFEEIEGALDMISELSSKLDTDDVSQLRDTIEKLDEIFESFENKLSDDSLFEDEKEFFSLTKKIKDALNELSEIEMFNKESFSSEFLSQKLVFENYECVVG